MSNLQLRVISAVVLAAAVLAATWFGGLPYRVFAVLVGAAILYEWVSMARASGRDLSPLWPGILLALLLALLLTQAVSNTWLLSGVALATLAAALAGRLSGESGFWSAGGLAYAALSAIALAGLRGSDSSGLVATLFLFAVVWATDIFAYFVGRAVGGPKLAPRISPGKTWSGAIGGTVCAVIAAMILLWAFGRAPGLAMVVVMVVLSAIAQCGDLFESWVKRRFGAKDSSKLIPGHGGVMDRVDGLVAAAIALYLIGGLSSGFDAPAAGLFGG